MRTAADVMKGRNERDWQRAQAEALVHIYRKHSTLVQTFATDKMIVDLVSQFFGVEPGSFVVTLSDFEFARSENPAEFRKAFGYGLTQPVEVQRQSVVADIAALLSPESFRAERGRLRGMNLEALKARRDEIRLKQQLQPHSAQEIREGLKTLRPQPGQREPLPEEWDRDRLMKASSHALKFLISRYGATQVNNRLSGKS